MANKSTRAGEVKATIELNGATHPFNSQTASVTPKDGYVLIDARQTVFGPFRIYQLILYIAQHAPAGSYVLDGKPDNTVQVSYLPPNGNIFDGFRDEHGLFSLAAIAELENIDGTFNCVSKSLNDTITARANITDGEVSIHGGRALSQGDLSGVFNMGNGQGRFNATKNITTSQADVYLQVEAVNDTSNTSLYLLIPKKHLDKKQVSITGHEDGESALAFLRHDKSYQGTAGVIEFQYNPTSRQLIGTFNFSASEEAFSFTNGKFNITG